MRNKSDAEIFKEIYENDIEECLKRLKLDRIRLKDINLELKKMKIMKNDNS